MWCWVSLLHRGTKTEIVGTVDTVESVRVVVAGRVVFQPSWATAPAAAGDTLTIFRAEAETITRGVTLQHAALHCFGMRVRLPSAIPPSFAGTAVRFLYSVSA